ncbi:MAG: gamma-glutamyl-gamma-aminobutyrate hydrolase family protein [Cyanobacteria bacterium P01_G01_bin.38]
MKSRALIAITARGAKEDSPLSVSAQYINALKQAGAQVCTFFPTDKKEEIESIISSVDGLVLSGGADIDPTLYGGESSRYTAELDVERDRFEIALAQVAMNRRIPVLGICRGMQILAIAEGGSLYTHLPDDLNTSQHRQECDLRKWLAASHDVEFAHRSLVARTLGEKIVSVVSCHHQAVKNLPDNWLAVGHASDGVIEAMEHSDHWAIGVQWHPEMTLERNVAHKRLFNSFVHQAVIRKT